MDHISALPNELKLMVADRLESNDALQLAATNSYMNTLIRPYVIEEDLKDEAVALIFAAWNGSVGTLRFVQTQVTPAMLQEALNKPVKVKVLLQQVLGANYRNDVDGRLGETFVLDLACWNGHAALVAMLLHYGALATNRDASNSNTALHHALDPRCARLLVIAGADINAVGQYNYIPMTAIIDIAGQVEGCMTLTQLPRPVNYTYQNVEATVKFLLNDAGADPLVFADDIEHPIGQAALWLFPDMVRVLLASGTPFPVSMDIGTRSFMEFLGEKVRETASEATYSSDFHNALSIVDICVEAGGDAGEVVHTLVEHIHAEADEDELDVVTRVIARLEDIGVQDANGHSPLQLSMLKNHRQVTRVLVEHGADLGGALLWYLLQSHSNTGCSHSDCLGRGIGRSPFPSQAVAGWDVWR